MVSCDCSAASPSSKGKTRMVITRFIPHLAAIYRNRLIALHRPILSSEDDEPAQDQRELIHMGPDRGPAYGAPTDCHRCDCTSRTRGDLRSPRNSRGISLVGCASMLLQAAYPARRISMMVRSMSSNTRPDTLMQDRILQAYRFLLQRTAGPYIRVSRVVPTRGKFAACLLWSERWGNRPASL